MSIDFEQPILPGFTTPQDDGTLSDVTDSHQEPGVGYQTRRVQGGIPSTDLVLSAYQCDNAEIFPKILQLHVQTGAIIADVTYGKGVFWKNVPETDYVVLSSDVQPANSTLQADCRYLPYRSDVLDCVVLDPPYMESLLRETIEHRGAVGTHVAFREAYRGGVPDNGRKRAEEAPKWHASVLDLYVKAGQEAYRVLHNEGVLLVKCQDEVSAGKQWFTHVEIINEYARIGFYAKDLFVVMRTNRPGVSRIKKQLHARKNHSYFLVFVKTRPPLPR